MNVTREMQRRINWRENRRLDRMDGNFAPAQRSTDPMPIRPEVICHHSLDRFVVCERCHAEVLRLAHLRDLRALKARLSRAHPRYKGIYIRWDVPRPLAILSHVEYLLRQRQRMREQLATPLFEERAQRPPWLDDSLLGVQPRLSPPVEELRRAMGGPIDWESLTASTIPKVPIGCFVPEPKPREAIVCEAVRRLRQEARDEAVYGPNAFLSRLHGPDHISNINRWFMGTDRLAGRGKAIKVPLDYSPAPPTPEPARPTIGSTVTERRAFAEALRERMEHDA